MKQQFYSDIRLPRNILRANRKRRCAEVACLCADPAARRVTGGCLPGTCPGGFPGLLYR